MLGSLILNNTHLLIPHLIYLEEVPIKIGEELRHYNLYRLDWDAVDTHKKHSYNKWANQYWKEQARSCGIDVDREAPTTLPTKYDSTIKSLTFVLSHNYKSAIEHYTQLYYIEWNRSKPFDTMIREMCLQPAIASINVAFKLLADCIYDSKSNKWLRSITVDQLVLDRWILKCLILYKFWNYSTGRGLIWEHAELDKLDNWMQLNLDTNKKCRSVNDKQISDINMVLHDIREFERNQEKFYSFVSIPGPDIELTEGETIQILNDNKD